MPLDIVGIFKKYPPATTEQFKDNIREVINNIPIEMCQPVFQHLGTTLEECYENDLDNIVRI